MILDILSQYVGSYAKFGIFNDSGFIGAAFRIVVLYLLVYFSKRGVTDTAHESAFNDLFPAIVIVLFLSIIGMPDVLKGIILFIVYYWTIKANGDFEVHTWFRIMLYITFALGISAFLSPSIAFFYLLIVLGVSYIQGNLRLRERRNQERAAQTEE